MDQSGVREVYFSYKKWKETGDRTSLDNAIMLVRSWAVLFSIIGILTCLLCSYPLSLSTFGNDTHTMGYVLLSPSVGLATITCCEIAILKATRKLKATALLSSINILVGIFTSIPFYYLYGMRGVIPAILLFSLCQMLIIMRFSFKSNPYRLKFEKLFLAIGKPMLVLGGAFVLQGFVEHGTKLAIQAFINNRGGLYDVGLYTSATTIMSMFLGIFASCIAVDYYPRLSGIFSDAEKRNITVNRQIDVLQIFTAPALVAFLIAVHLIVPVLLSKDFIGVIPILEISLITCPTRSIARPMAFIPLAAGESRFFIFANMIDSLLMFVVFTACYAHFGLIGIAYGICLYNTLDLIWICSCIKIKYNIIPNKRNIIFFLCQTTILILASQLTKDDNQWEYWGLGTLLIATSLGCSLKLLNIIKHEK